MLRGKLIDSHLISTLGVIVVSNSLSAISPLALLLSPPQNVISLIVGNLLWTHLWFLF